MQSVLTILAFRKTYLTIGTLAGNSSINVEDSEEDRRTSFVDSLLKVDDSRSTVPTDVTDGIAQENIPHPPVKENENSAVSGVDSVPESMFFHCLFRWIGQQVLYRIPILILEPS